MYRNAVIRSAILLLVGMVAAKFPIYVDDWLWRGVRDIVGANARFAVLAVSVVMVLADCVGAWCPPCRIAVRRPVRWSIVLGAGAAAVLWWLRLPQWLGDLVTVDKGPLPPRLVLEAAEPLGMLTTYGALHASAAWGFKASTGVALLSTLFGASAVVALFLWARCLTDEWPLAWAMLVSPAFMILFFGYPEKGTPKSVALVCWYVYLTTRTLRERRASLLVGSSAVLSVAGLMHGSALCWLPAHAWYVWRRGSWRWAALGVGAFLAPVAALVVFVAWAHPINPEGLGNIRAPLQWIKAYCVSNCGYDFWSAGHLVDAFDCLLLLSPVATLCVPEALAYARGAEERWLALGALGWLFLSATWFPVFGYLPDWDIFAGTPLVICCLAVVVGLRVMPAAGFRRLAFAWIVGSALHTFSWWRFFHLPL